MVMFVICWLCYLITHVLPSVATIRHDSLTCNRTTIQSYTHQPCLPYRVHCMDRLVASWCVRASIPNLALLGSGAKYDTFSQNPPLSLVVSVSSGNNAVDGTARVSLQGGAVSARVLKQGPPIRVGLTGSVRDYVLSVDNLMTPPASNTPPPPPGGSGSGRRLTSATGSGLKNSAREKMLASDGARRGAGAAATASIKASNGNVKGGGMRK